MDLKTEQLNKCDKDRLEILKDLLQTQLGIDTSVEPRQEPPSKCIGYLLGTHDVKSDFIDSFQVFSNEGKLERNLLDLLFFKEKPCKPVENESEKNILQVAMTGYPNDFSTVRYFEVITKYSSLRRFCLKLFDFRLYHRRKLEEWPFIVMLFLLRWTC